jgi:hypothetical protein
MMKHYTSEEWLDLARGVAALGNVCEMQKHLEDCASCKEIANEMNRLFEMSRREGSYQPPQDAVRNAKSLMTMQRIASATPAERHFLKAVFDSAFQPLQAGIRGAVTARQLLYQKENCCIDLRLEMKPGSRIEMIGQVLDSGAIGRGLNEIPVTLQRGAELLARTLTNQFGEFHFVIDDTKNVEMVVEVTEDRRLIVPLPH